MFLRKSLPTLAVLLHIVTYGCGVDTKLTEVLDPGGDPLNPVAAIETDTQVRVKNQVTLDGSSSYDHKNESLTFEWTLTKPTGSAAELTSDTAAITTFFADKGGFYTVTLKVTNESGLGSKVTSAQIDIVGTGQNHPPVAVVETTVSDAFVILDGSSSYDVDGQGLTYEWSLLNAPAGASSSINNGSSPIAYLISNANANLAVRLKVSDGVDSDEAYATVDNSP